MGLLSKMFGAGKSPEAQKKSDKERYNDLIKEGKSPGTAVYMVGAERKKRIEENAFRQEKQRRENKKAREKGIARATPLSEKFGNTVAGIGKVIQSDAFQGVARRGASYSDWAMSGKSISGKSRSRKKKGKKGKKSKRNNTRRAQSAPFFDML